MSLVYREIKEGEELLKDFKKNLPKYIEGETYQGTSEEDAIKSIKERKKLLKKKIKSLKKQIKRPAIDIVNGWLFVGTSDGNKAVRISNIKQVRMMAEPNDLENPQVYIVGFMDESGSMLMSVSTDNPKYAENLIGMRKWK